MLAKAALLLNGLALLPALVGVVLLGVLANLFIASSGSDRTMGWLGLLLGIPLLLAGPSLGLWLALRPSQSWSLALSCVLGGLWLLLVAVSLFLLPTMIEVAARP